MKSDNRNGNNKQNNKEKLKSVSLFRMPNLTEKQKKELLSFVDQDEINEWVEDIYGINITSKI